MKRSVFFVSDRTGITAETLAHSLLTQFEGIEFEKYNFPFIDNTQKVDEVLQRVNAVAENGGRPLIFSTLVDAELRARLEQADCLVIDMFHAFILPLEKELGVASSHAIGRSHGVGNDTTYQARIDAVNFALANERNVIKVPKDVPLEILGPLGCGVISTTNFGMADVILVGVSRTGKTPTSLYLGLQFGICAANYPLTEDDLANDLLPPALDGYRDKLFGLSILPERLRQIRQERRPDSEYASLKQCEREVRRVEAMFRRDGIPFINTSAMSIEEIATTVIQHNKLQRRWFG